MVSTMTARRAWVSVDHVLFVLNSRSQGPGEPVRWMAVCQYRQRSDLTGLIQTTKATSLRLQTPLELG